MPILGGVVSFLGSIVTGIFGLKRDQSQVVQKSIDLAGTVEKGDEARATAIAQVLTSEAGAGGLAANWRPLTMLVFLGLIVSFWFGYVPPNLEGPMPPMVAELFGIIKIGIAGYIPCRTLEKIVSQINLSSLLKQLVRKKVL